MVLVTDHSSEKGCPCSRTPDVEGFASGCVVVSVRVRSRTQDDDDVCGWPPGRCSGGRQRSLGAAVRERRVIFTECPDTTSADEKSHARQHSRAAAAALAHPPRCGPRDPMATPASAPTHPANCSSQLAGTPQCITYILAVEAQHTCHHIFDWHQHASAPAATTTTTTTTTATTTTATPPDPAGRHRQHRHWVMGGCAA